jgi:MFS family permease
MLLFSLVYILIFLGYYVTTSFLTILYPDFAFVSFAIFYGVYAIGSLVSVLLLEQMNFRLLLFLSCVTFCIFVGFAGSGIVSLLLVGSVIGGLGNSVIWLVQGVFLESKDMAKFYMLFNINNIAGSLIALIVLLSGLSSQIMILIILSSAVIGTILSLFLKEKVQIEREVLNKKFSLVKIFTPGKEIYLLFLSFVYQSVALNITYQVLPKLVKSPMYNAVTFIVYGVSACGASWLSGKLFVKNWKIVVIGYGSLEVICLSLILIFGKLFNEPGLYIVIGFLRGIIDYSVNNVINITLSSTNNKENVRNFFSLYRFIYAIAYLLTSICIGYISYEYILLICFIFLISSIITYFIFKKREVSNFLEDINKQFEESEIKL